MEGQDKDNGFKLKRGGLSRYQSEDFYSEGGEALAQLPREAVAAPSFKAGIT